MLRVPSAFQEKEEKEMRKCAVFFLLCVMVLSFGAVPASAAKYNWRLAKQRDRKSVV